MRVFICAVIAIRAVAVLVTFGLFSGAAAFEIFPREESGSRFNAAAAKMGLKVKATQRGCARGVCAFSVGSTTFAAKYETEYKNQFIVPVESDGSPVDLILTLYVIAAMVEPGVDRKARDNEINSLIDRATRERLPAPAGFGQAIVKTVPGDTLRPRGFIISKID